MFVLTTVSAAGVRGRWRGGGGGGGYINKYKWKQLYTTGDSIKTINWVKGKGSNQLVI